MLLVTPRIAGVWVGVRVLTWPWLMVTRLLSLLVMQRPSCHTDISDPSNQQIQTDSGRNPLQCSGRQSYTHRRDAAALVIGYWLPH